MFIDHSDFLLCKFLFSVLPIFLLVFLYVFIQTTCIVNCLSRSVDCLFTLINVLINKLFFAFWFFLVFTFRSTIYLEFVSTQHDIGISAFFPPYENPVECMSIACWLYSLLSGNDKCSHHLLVFRVGWNFSSPSAQWSSFGFPLA